MKGTELMIRKELPEAIFQLKNVSFVRKLTAKRSVYLSIPQKLKSLPDDFQIIDNLIIVRREQIES